MPPFGLVVLAFLPVMGFVTMLVLQAALNELGLPSTLQAQIIRNGKALPPGPLNFGDASATALVPLTLVAPALPGGMIRTSARAVHTGDDSDDDYKRAPDGCINPD